MEDSTVKTAMYFDRVQDVVDELDKYNFSYILNKCIDQRITNIYDLSDAISQVCGSYVEELIDELDIFDLQDYLMDRYNIRFSENITYHAYRCSGNKIYKVRNNNTD